jgi:DNA-binding protein HU-beta
MAAPKKVAETVTLKTVFEQLAAGHDLSKKRARSLLTDFVASVTSILKNGDRVRMSGLGIIEVKDRPARMGRNTATGAAVQIAASRSGEFEWWPWLSNAPRLMSSVMRCDDKSPG